MSYIELLEFAVTLTTVQVIGVLIGLFAFRYLDSYWSTKGSLQAELEESPRLISIEKRLARLSEVSTDLGRAKLEAYIELGSYFAQLVKEFEVIREWARRIKNDDELAKLSREFSGEGSVSRIGDILQNIEAVRLSRDWLLHWKVAAVLYAVKIKGGELMSALNEFSRETNRWEIKRSHLLAVSGLANVFHEFRELCSEAAREDLESGEYSTQQKPPDDEFKSFAKKLGDIGRDESRRFKEKYPEEWRTLREVNARLRAERSAAFKEDLASNLNDEMASEE
jgi:hypothetical protein